MDSKPKKKSLESKINETGTESNPFFVIKQNGAFKIKG